MGSKQNIICVNHSKYQKSFEWKFCFSVFLIIRIQKKRDWKALLKAFECKLWMKYYKLFISDFEIVSFKNFKCIFEQTIIKHDNSQLKFKKKTYSILCIHWLTYIPPLFEQFESSNRKGTYLCRPRIKASVNEFSVYKWFYQRKYHLSSIEKLHC